MKTGNDMAKRVVVLHSGGMDSTTCLYKAQAEGSEVFSLGVDYGQKLSVELLFAQRHCDILGIEREVINVTWRKPDREIPLNRSIDEMKNSISKAFLPARNVVFLSVASAYAAGVGADEIHIGINCVDFSGYPDCTESFLDSYSKMMSIADPNGPKIVAPLLNMSKVSIAKLAHSLGIGEHDTWSCYRPEVDSGSVTPCGKCDACRLHSHSWGTLET